MESDGTQVQISVNIISSGYSLNFLFFQSGFLVVHSFDYSEV